MLPESYIIFLCTRDQFGWGRPVYTFDMACAEADGVGLGHGFRWIVLNAAAWREVEEKSLRHLLEYIDTRRVVDDPLVAEISKRVGRANSDDEWKRESRRMITFEEDMKAQMGIRERRAREEGRAEGQTEGIDRAMTLMAALAKDGRDDDASLAMRDHAARERLFAEYNL